MIGSLVRATGNRAGLLFLVIWLAIAAIAAAQEPPNSAAPDRSGGIAASRAEMLFFTSLWKGDRYPDGRPKVSDDLLKRMKAVSIEEAWDVLRLARLRESVRGRLADAPSGPTVRGPGPHRRVPAQPARSRRTDHEERQGGRPDRPLELLADRHAPAAGTSTSPTGSARWPMEP